MAARPDRSDPLAMLNRLDGTRVFLGTLVLALVGLFLPGWYGAAMLTAIVVALGLLQARTWRRSPPALRLIRIAALIALLGVAVTKVL